MPSERTNERLDLDLIKSSRSESRGPLKNKTIFDLPLKSLVATPPAVIAFLIGTTRKLLKLFSGKSLDLFSCWQLEL